MKIKIISLMALSLAFALSGRSQTTTSDDVLINGDNGTVNLRVTGDNGALFTGTFGSGTIPATGAGTRMMWYPKKAAFRVGNVSDVVWDDEYIGAYSTAFGQDTYSYGWYSFAAGHESYAGGTGSLALGLGAVAEGEGSFSVNGVARGMYDCAINGFTEESYGNNFAFGGYIYWSGDCVTIGENVINGAAGAVAIGNQLETVTFRSTVLGSYNVPDYSGDGDSWIASDQLVVIGNGTDTQLQSNALVVTKDANMRTGGKGEFKGGLRAARLGDLSMGAFTSGDNPGDLDVALEYP